MFYGKGAEEPLFQLRKMIFSKTVEERRKALDELFPHVKADIKATLEAMDGLPVTIRLLDPPLHEFVPHREDKRQRAGRGARHHARRAGQARRGPARDQPDDGPPRRAPGHHLSRGHRDADPRDLRGRRRADQGRQEGHPRDHDPGHLRRERELKHQAALVEKVHAEVAAKFKREEASRTLSAR